MRACRLCQRALAEDAWEEPLARAQLIERQHAEDVQENEKQRNEVHDAHAEGGQHADGVHTG